MSRRVRSGSLCALVALLSGLVLTVHAQNAPDIVVPPGYQITEFASGLSAPIAASVAPNGDVYVLNSGSGGVGGAAPTEVQVWKVTPSGQKTMLYSSDETPGLVPVALGIYATDDDTIFINDAEGIKRLHRDGSVQTLQLLPVQGDHAADHIVKAAPRTVGWLVRTTAGSGATPSFTTFRART
jgi:hypothetical protein